MNVQRLKQSCLAQKSPDLKDGVILELIEILEAAEAKLSELEKQQAVGVARMEMAIGKEGLRYYQCFVDMRPDLVVAELNTGMELFTRPAPAVSLAKLMPEGWKLVPVEPTEEMIAAGDQFMDGLSRLGNAYEAMLAAAPEVE
ncbi:hypothetical protein [Pantoea agglomerans]|uniref:hypothetical protein n=1 Tax=Enterobacter agglomerans TaxID=549 RepID=UPI0002554135|nr:hypothetical protein [Pantoea agglomerans]